jgi:hypothetical protein
LRLAGLGSASVPCLYYGTVRKRPSYETPQCRQGHRVSTKRRKTELLPIEVLPSRVTSSTCFQSSIARQGHIIISEALACDLGKRTSGAPAWGGSLPVSSTFPPCGVFPFKSYIRSRNVKAFRCPLRLSSLMKPHCLVKYLQTSTTTQLSLSEAS